MLACLIVAMPCFLPTPSARAFYSLVMLKHWIGLGECFRSAVCCCSGEAAEQLPRWAAEYEEQLQADPGNTEKWLLYAMEHVNFCQGAVSGVLVVLLWSKSNFCCCLLAFPSNVSSNYITF